MAIRLMRAAEVPETPRDRVYLYSRINAVLIVCVCIAACTAVLILRWPLAILSYYIAGVILFVLLLMWRFIGARFYPSNWLVRASDAGLFLQLRSYLNYHLPAEDPTVVFLAYSDIRSARRIREKVKTLDSEGKQVRSRRLVELELAADPSPLRAALSAECARPAASQRRWYGKSSTLYRHYPVTMRTLPFLRLEWTVVPDAKNFLTLLREHHIEIAPSVVVEEDFTNLENLSAEEQRQRLRDLDQRGQRIAAVYLASKLYQCDTTRAMEILREISGTNLKLR